MRRGLADRLNCSIGIDTRNQRVADLRKKASAVEGLRMQFELVKQSPTSPVWLNQGGPILDRNQARGQGNRLLQQVQELADMVTVLMAQTALGNQASGRAVDMSMYCNSILCN